MWPGPISRASLNPYYRRAELGLRVNRPSWNQVSKSGGLWAANLRAAGHTCDRVPLAISPKRCVNVKWCHTGCVFGAKNSLYTNYLPSAERLGVKIRPHAQVESVRQVQNRPYRYSVTVSNIDPASRQPAGQLRDRVQGAGARHRGHGQLADPDALAQRPAVALRAARPPPGRERRPHRRDRVRPEARARGARACPPTRDFHKGKPITTMTYDFWVGPPRERVRRHALHAPGDLPLARSPTSSTTTAATPAATPPGGASRRRTRSPTGPTGSSCWRWSRTPTTATSSPCRRPAVAPCGRTPARWRSGCSTTSSPSSRGACASRPTRR